MTAFYHFNFNVLDLEKSIAFYKEALGLEIVREKEASDGSFKLVFLGEKHTDFQLELTWLKDRTKPYDLGECEFHLLCFVVVFARAHSAPVGGACHFGGREVDDKFSGAADDGVGVSFGTH